VFDVNLKKISKKIYCATNSIKYNYSYTITPSNFLILSEDKQRKKLNEFFELLNTLEKEIMITLERADITVPYKGKNTKMQILQVLVDSIDPLDDVLEKLGFICSIDELHEPLKIEEEYLRSFSINNKITKYYGRAYTIYDMPTLLRPAWIHSVFASFHKLQIYISPVKMDIAMKKIDNLELMYIDNKSNKATIQKKLNDIQILKKDLELSNTKIFNFSIIGYIFGKSKSDLLSLQTEVRKNMGAINVRVTSSMADQQNMINGGGASWLSDIGSMAVLYPFASSDMIEIPNGIFIGINKDTGSPIIYDVNSRKNYNIFTAGTTGGGKSFTNKILVKRFLEKRPKTMCCIIDPQGEYLPYAEYFGLDTIELIPDHQYGLDPFKLFDTKIEAADLIGTVTNAPNPIRKEWRSICNEIENIESLYDKSSVEAKKYLVDLVKGGLSQMFKEDLKFSDRMIISLKKIDGQEYEGLLILLVLAYVWKKVNSLPSNIWKFILLDEAWKMTKLDASIKKIGEIARQGRKKSLIFALSTQSFGDLDRAMDDESKLTELFDTKIIMQMSQSAAKQTGNALGLTDDEIERIINFKIGNGMIQTSDNTIYAKFEATDEETKTYFNTKERK